MKKQAIISDIDGVLLDVSRIYKEIHKRKLKGEEKWEFFHKYANNPEWAIKNKEMFQLINSFLMNNDIELFLVTARKNCLYYSTGSYLFKATKVDEPYIFYISKARIITRNMEDKRESAEFKETELKYIQKDYDVVLAIDDELQNCLMYQRNGIRTLRVMNND